MKELNKILKHHVDKHESEVDPQEIWEGILKKQEPKKKRGWFFLFPLIALVGVSFFLFTSLYDNSSYAPVSETTPAPQPLSSLSDKSEASVINSKAVTIDNIAENNTVVSEVIETSNITNEAAVTIIDEQEKDYISNANQTNTLRAKTFSSSITTTTFNKPKTLLQSAKGNYKTTSPITKGINSHFAIKKDLNSQILLIENLFTLPIIRRNIFTERKIEGLPSYADPIAPTVVNEKLIRLAVTTGVGIMNKSFLQSDILSSEHLLARQESEIALEAIRGQLQVELGITNSLSLRSGVKYLRLNEKFDWIDTYLTDDSGNILSTLNDDTEGNPIVNVSAIANPNVLHYSVENQVIHYNSHHLVDIPLVLAYNMRWRNIRASLYGGGSVNVLSASKGKYLDTNMLIADYSGRELTSRVGYLGGLSIDLPIYERVALRVALDYETRKTQNLGLYARYKSMVGSLGIAYKL